MIGVGCPGVIHEDGSIARGAQNLPGNWESSRFNLPAQHRRACARSIGDHETLVVMHNDAVVQGLSELPYVKDRTALGRADHRHRASATRASPIASGQGAKTNGKDCSQVDP